MRPDLLLFAAELARQGEAFVLATVVRREAPSSARVGDTAVVTQGGAFHGWVGGSCTQPTVVREALRALADRVPRLIALSPNAAEDRRPGVDAFPMTCHSGGSVDIYIQPVLPAPRLIVFGASPVGQALVRLGKAMGYSVDAVDPGADRASFPEADRVVTQAGKMDGGGGAFVCAVVATMGHWDEEALAAALALAPRPAYLGIVASRTRFAQIRATLGNMSDSLADVRNPAGLDLGAQLPEEIALSVFAEIVQVRCAQRPTAAAPAEARATAPITEALDPICGMTVSVATARHTAEFDGRTFYFCCGGCRAQFLKEPARYAAAEGRA
jgi:xanthine dehydrogenase accessory factor